MRVDNAVAVGDPGALVIDPIGMQVEIDVAGPSRLVDLARAAFGDRGLVVFGRADRAVAQAEQQIVAQGAGKQVGGRADIADPAADHRERQRRDVGAADRDAAARRPDQAREQQGELVLAAAALADDRDMLVERRRKADAVEDAAAVVLGQRQIGDDQLAGQRRDALGLLEQQARIGHARRLELLDDLLVLDPRIFFLLVEIEQLLPRRGQVLVGGQHRHQRAERQAAADHQIAADRIRRKNGVSWSMKLLRNLTKNLR